MRCSLTQVSEFNWRRDLKTWARETFGCLSRATLLHIAGRESAQVSNTSTSTYRDEYYPTRDTHNARQTLHALVHIWSFNRSLAASALMCAFCVPRASRWLPLSGWVRALLQDASTRRTSPVTSKERRESHSSTAIIVWLRATYE